MQVHGIKITPAQQQAMRLAMVGSFQAKAVERAAQVAGVPEQVGEGLRTHPVAMRAADRVIQQARKAGMIVRAGRGWVAAPGLTLTPEPRGLEAYGQEGCCFCQAATAYWTHEVAVCEGCAATHSVAQLPSKALWFALAQPAADFAG